MKSHLIKYLIKDTYDSGKKNIRSKFGVKDVYVTFFRRKIQFFKNVLYTLKTFCEKYKFQKNCDNSDFMQFCTILLQNFN